MLDNLTRAREHQGGVTVIESGQVQGGSPARSAEAAATIVRGFVEPIAREPPME